MTKTKQREFPTLAAAKKALRPFLEPKLFRPVKGEPHLLETTEARDPEGSEWGRKKRPLCTIVFRHGCRHASDEKVCYVTSISILTDMGPRKGERRTTVSATKSGFNWTRVGERVATALRDARADREWREKEAAAEAGKRASYIERQKQAAKAFADRGVLNEPYKEDLGVGFGVTQRHEGFSLDFHGLSMPLMEKLLDTYVEATK